MAFGRSSRRCTRSVRKPFGPVSGRAMLVQWVALAGLLVITILVATRDRSFEPRHSHQDSQGALVGFARVIDGDTLYVAGIKVRLDGIDAVEAKQTCTRGGQRWSCGQSATRQLVGLIAGQQVTCTANGHDRYSRALAFCSAGARELNREMVRSGLALASGAFQSEEWEARLGGRGVWSGDFEHPREWRRRHERAAAPDCGADSRTLRVCPQPRWRPG
jgi:endonuclease YncB( thermonuclease family)